jgi:hypothetical protein
MDLSQLLIGWAAGFSLMGGVWGLRKALKRKVFQKSTCEGSHLWRTIAEPYARQCRVCGVTQFRLDAHGIFPDGLKEYFDYIDRLPVEARRTPPPPDLCHCGAQMNFTVDDTLGEIWLCPICSSWRKTYKQDRIDTENLKKGDTKE